MCKVLARGSSTRGAWGSAWRPSMSEQSQAEVLIHLLDDRGVECSRTPSGVLYASIRDGQCVDHRPIASRPFRRLLQRLFFEEFQQALRGEALRDALGVLEGRALCGDEHEVHLRVAGDAR